MYRVTEIIHHGDYRNTRTLDTETLDGPTLQAWGEGSPYAWRGLDVGEHVAYALRTSGAASHGWARYVVEDVEI